MPWVRSEAPARPGSPLDRWRATVGTAIVLQWTGVAVASLAAGLLSGPAAAASVFGGGAAVAVSNTVLALWLTLRVAKSGALPAAAMLGGELLKLGLMLALLAIAARGLAPVSPVALAVGVLVALKTQWLALWFTRTN